MCINFAHIGPDDGRCTAMAYFDMASEFHRSCRFQIRTDTQASTEISSMFMYTHVYK